MKLTFGKGLSDALPSEMADGFVSSVDGFRFREGFAELIGGNGSTIANASGTGVSLSQLYTAAATYVVMSATSSLAAYSIGAGTTSTITRKTEGVTISNATAAGTTVTITTATNHGRTTGNTISAWGFTPSTYNVESAAITVLTPTTFTYVVPSAPAVTPATAMGMYSVDATTSNISVTPGGELNGVLILNSTSAGCYYWGGSTTIPLRKVVGSYASRASVPFGNYIVQLAPTISGTEYPYRILWSNAADPGSVPHNGFVAALTNQAGSVEKPEIGEMVWALPLGEDLIIYGTKGRMLMHYIGGINVFQFTKLPGDEGLYAAGMVVETPVGHVFVDRDRHVRVHSGGATRDISMGRVQSLLGEGAFSIGSSTQIAWVVNNTRQSEVWIAYAIAGSSAASSYAVLWNWEEDTWGRTTVTSKVSALSVRTSAATSMYATLYALTSTGATLNIIDNHAERITSAYIERVGIDAGSAEIVKNLQRSRWNIEPISSGLPTYTVSHGSSMYADTAPTYATGITYVPGTDDYVDGRATGGRYLAVKLTVSTALGLSQPFPFHQIRVRSADIDFTTGGKR